MVQVITPGHELWNSTNYVAELKRQGYTQSRRYYPGMKLINSFKVVTAYKATDPGQVRYGATAYVYTYPEYTVSRQTAISYESIGTIYYDNDIEEKLGGERVTLGQ